MINVTKKSECCGCHACMNICPKGAIEMIKDNDGFKYPVINQKKCNHIRKTTYKKIRTTLFHPPLHGHRGTKNRSRIIFNNNRRYVRC